MRESKRLIKNTLIIAVGGLSTKLISFLLLPLYTALLSAEEYGAMDYASTIAMFLVPFASMLMDETVFRFLVDAKNLNDVKSDLSHSLVIVLGGCFGFLLLGGVGTYILKYQYAWFLLMYVICASLTGWLSAYFRGTGRMKEYAIFNFTCGSVLILLNVICIAGLGLGLFGMMLSSICAHVLTDIVFATKYRIFSYISFSGIRIERALEMLRYAFPLIPNRLSWSAVSLTNRVIIVTVLGEAANGLFALANRFSSLINTAYGFFYQSWIESAARVKSRDDGKEIEHYYNSTYKNVQNFVFSVIIVCIAIMPFIYRVLNSEFSKSFYLIPILMIAVYFDSLASFIGGIFTAFKNTKILGKTTVFAAGINLIVCSACVGFIGIYAAAISTLLGNVAVFLYRRKLVERYVILSDEIMETVKKLLIIAAVLIAFYNENTNIHIASLCFSTVMAGYLNRDILRALRNNIHKRGGKI